MSTVGEAPALKEEIQDVTTKLGESGTLTCGIVGRPLPEIKWYRYGKELIQSRKYKVSSDGRNHSLSILTDEQEDEGVYTCRAVNDAGEIETSGKLRLQAAPQFHPGFPLKEKYNAGCGTSLRLHVVYIGRPIPQIMWFYGKKPLNTSENVIIENTESYTHLVVRNVQRKTNAGRYKVQLSNVYGTVDTSLRVEIQGNFIFCNDQLHKICYNNVWTYKYNSLMYIYFYHLFKQTSHAYLKVPLLLMPCLRARSSLAGKLPRMMEAP